MVHGPRRASSRVLDIFRTPEVDHTRLSFYSSLVRSKLYEEVKWPTGNYPNLWLRVYQCIYFVCLPACFFLFACGCFKTGNIAGDNERLADREERILEVSRNSRGEKKGQSSLFSYSFLIRPRVTSFLCPSARIKILIIEPLGTGCAHTQPVVLPSV